MPEPLKNLVNTSLLRSAGADIKAVYPAFDQDQWEKLVFHDPAFPSLELKQRLRHAATTLRHVLPADLKVDYADFFIFTGWKTLICAGNNGFKTMKRPF